MSGLRKRSIVIYGHRTSLSLEQAFWQVLRLLAAEQGQSINALIQSIDEARTEQEINLSSTVRCHVLKQLVARSDLASHPELKALLPPAFSEAGAKT